MKNGIHRRLNAQIITHRNTTVTHERATFIILRLCEAIYRKAFCYNGISLNMEYRDVSEEDN